MKPIILGFFIFIGTLLYFRSETALFVSAFIGIGLIFIGATFSIKKKDEKDKWFKNERKVKLFNSAEGFFISMGLIPLLLSLGIMYILK